MRHASVAAAAVVALQLAACAPKAAPIAGVPAPVEAIPATRLQGHERLAFRWEYADGSFIGRGEGVARVAGPDSVRLDFFLDGGLGGGTAYLIGDQVTAPGGDMVRRLLPPPALLWAALGRLAIPPAPDTVVRRDAQIVHAEIGSAPVYRVSFEGDRLVRLERIDDGRLREWVAHPSDDRVEYRNEGAKRQLALTITARARTGPFDADIWN